MLKIIAFLSMLLDHIGIVYFPNIIVFRIIGRLAFPLFAWGIARGYKYTKSFKNYVTRLFILALISQYPYSLLFKTNNLNICFTLLAGLFVLKIYDYKFKLWLKMLLIAFILTISQYFNFEYGIYGILTIFIFYYLWNKECVIYYQGILTLISIIIFKFNPIQLFAVFSFILILILNKYDFKLNKVLQYSFYPLHLFVLFILKKEGII